MIKKAVIPAAGLGTRFLPATKAQPKEMLPIVDTPAIQFIVEEAVASGIEDIIIITGRTKKSIEDHFDRSIELEFELREKGNTAMLESVKRLSELANIHFIRQKEARGLGHAIACAHTFTGDEPFAVLLGDDIVKSSEPALLQLIKAHETTGATILGVQEVAREQANRYGMISPKRGSSGPLIEIDDLVEKPEIEDAPSNIAIMGRYVITPRIFSCIEQTKPGSGGEIQLTDALRSMLIHEKMFACPFVGKRYDVGDRLGFLAATVEFALAREDLSAPFTGYLADVVESHPELRQAVYSRICKQ